MTNKKIEMIIPKKFSEKQIGEFMTKFWNKHKNITPNIVFYFDFTQTEWMANQNLLLLSGLIKYMYKSNIKFKIRLFPDNLNSMNKKQATQICQLWDIWKLHRIFDETRHFDLYIENFSNSKIPYLYDHFKIRLNNQELFDQFSVIPFVNLNFIENAHYENINAQLKPIYSLNNIIANELKDCKCEHPFINKTISAIITKELYDNFLDHFKYSIFTSTQNWAFMSISLQKNLSLKNEKYNLENCKNEEDVFNYIEQGMPKYYLDRIKSLIKSKKLDFFSNKEKYISEIIEYNKQSLSKFNFETQELEATSSFFYDNKTNKFKNENLIQFSFVDFGIGIVESIQDQYKKEYKIPNATQINHNDVLKYAFKHNSSRNPILDRYKKEINYVPRGLFAVLSIVQRYKGLLIVRSNKGKIYYNFSNTNLIAEAVSTFDENEDEVFLGTYISIYIPAWEDGHFDESVIRPKYEGINIPKRARNINLFSLFSKLDTDKSYTQLLESLSEKLKFDKNYNWLTYISFFGVKDINIIQKTIFFLAGNNEISENNSIIIVFPPDKDIIETINKEIILLDVNDALFAKYYILPIPCVYQDKITGNIFLEWIGVFNEQDKKILNSLLYDEFSLAISDFSDGYKAIGNTNSIDNYGNFCSRIPAKSKLSEYYEKYLFEYTKELKFSDDYNSTLINDAITELNCIKKDGVYLCNGNYYQRSFLQLSDLLIGKKYKNIIPEFLLHKINVQIRKNTGLIADSDKIGYIAITASSHKILESLIEQKIILEENCIFCDSYLCFEDEIKEDIKKKIKNDVKKFILVCDAIATGKLTRRLDDIINGYEVELIAVGTIVNTLDEEFEGYAEFHQTFENRFIDLFQYSIQKLKWQDLTKEEQQNSPIRVNPYTNIPITLEECETLINETALLSNEVFLECIEDEDIEVRFKLLNNLIHPYYFNTAEILKKENNKIKEGNYSKSIIYKIFKTLQTKKGYKAVDYIFYPKRSDILSLDFEQIKTKILKNGDVETHALDRHKSNTGWKFPHTTNYFKEGIKDKIVLIMDDGSCSGDSLYQMITEVSYYIPHKIYVISIVGRMEDHKREFFSKIGSIKTIQPDGTNKFIELEVYFGVHWHIPTFYQEENKYKDELRWIELISKIMNTPKEVIKYADNIKKEIETNALEEKAYDYKYLPKDSLTKETPNKEILKIRNEIGRIIGFRFYKESFNWFNDFIRENHYRNFTNKEQNRNLEYLLMCIVYEPYLYKEITRIMPQIRDIIEAFLEKTIFNSEINIQEHLSYDWNPIDISHIYFTVYYDERLSNNLNKERFEKLLSYVSVIGKNAVNYILYKLSFYSPMNNEKYTEIFKSIRKTIDDYLQGHKNESDKNVKYFKYFISSIPFGEDFGETIDCLFNEYSKIHCTTPEHRESVKARLDTAATILDTYIKNIKDRPASDLFEMKDNLELVFQVVGRILRLSRENPAYFSKYINWFEENDNSLRNRYEFLYSNIENIENVNIETLHKILKHIREVKDRFFDEGSTDKIRAPYEIFHNRHTLDFINVLESHIRKFDDDEIGHSIELQGEYKNKIAIVFPEFVLDNIILTNLFLNIKRYAKLSVLIVIQVEEKDSKVIMTIKNGIREDVVDEGGLIGLNLINNLKKCPGRIFDYFNNENDKDKTDFRQTLTFKLA